MNVVLTLLKGKIVLQHFKEYQGVVAVMHKDTYTTDFILNEIIDRGVAKALLPVKLAYHRQVFCMRRYYLYIGGKLGFKSSSWTTLLHF
jgi:hypothetical protein